MRAAVERSALHDEVQDFEGQIRRLADGTGLMNDADFAAGTRSQPMGTPKACVSADLDALAAYVGSLTPAGASRGLDRGPTARGRIGGIPGPRRPTAKGPP